MTGLSVLTSWAFDESRCGFVVCTNADYDNPDIQFQTKHLEKVEPRDRKQFVEQTIAKLQSVYPTDPGYVFNGMNAYFELPIKLPLSNAYWLSYEKPVESLEEQINDFYAVQHSHLKIDPNLFVKISENDPLAEFNRSRNLLDDVRSDMDSRLLITEAFLLMSRVAVVLHKEADQRRNTRW